MIDRKRLRVFAQEVSKQIEYDLLAGAATVYALTHQNPPHDSRMFRGTATSTPSKSAIDDLLDALDSIRSAPPTPVAIWLVDRPDILPRVLKEFPLAPGPEGDTLRRSVYELRILQVDSISYDPKIHPAWCAVQGCYAEMSDGSIRLLDM